MATPRQWRDVAVTVVGTLAAVALINLSLAVYLNVYEPNRGYASIRVKWQQVESGERHDWWILGDSVADQSLIPNDIAAALGGSAYSYATTGHMGVVNSAWMLDRLIERHGPPRGVILMHAYDVWRRPITLASMAHAPLEWNFWARSQPPVPLTLGQRLSLLLHRYVPLLSRDGTISHLVTHPRALFRGAPPHADDGRRVVPTAQPDDVVTDTQRHLDALKTVGRFEPHPQSDAALRRMKQAAQTHRFPLIIAGTPTVEDLAVTPRFMRYYAEIQRWLPRYTDASVYQVLPGAMPFPATMMDNADPLFEVGARLFTTRFLKALPSDLQALGAGASTPDH